jgi:hypothetical protein
VITFFIGFFGAFGDFTAGSTSCDSGSSTIGVSVIGAAAANLFGFSSSLRKEAKDKIHLSKSTGKKIIYENKVEGHSRVHEVEELYVALWREGFPGHSFMSGGTRGSELFDTLPLLVNAKIFRKHRRR